METVGLTRLLPERLRRMQRQLPVLGRRLPALPEFLPAKGDRRATVGLFLGCVADGMFRHVHWATARVSPGKRLRRCDSSIPGLLRSHSLSQRCIGTRYPTDQTKCGQL